MAASDQGTVVLASEGKVQCFLRCLPWQSAGDMLGPADELVHYLEQSLGQPIVTEDVRSTPPAGPVVLTLHYDILAPLEREEFEIEATPDAVTLRACTIQGLFHAVYWFLETTVGVRWLWPGETGEVVPAHRDLAVPLGMQRHRPDYAWRALQTGGAAWAAQDIDTVLHGVLRLPLSYLEEFGRWCRRNRFGGLKVADGHRWAEIAPPQVYAREHPEYYALIAGERDSQPHDGKHHNQPCLSNPDVIRLIANYAAARFTAQRDLDVASVAPNDGPSPCECSKCQAIDRAIDAEMGPEIIHPLEHVDPATAEGIDPRILRYVSMPASTDRLFLHAQRVVEALNGRFADRMLLTQLYSTSRRPPRKYHLPEQYIGQYAVRADLFWNEPLRHIESRRFRAMSKYVPSLGIYEYYSNGAWPEIHRLCPHLVAGSVREFYEAGARYFATQPSTGFAANGLNLYMLGRCLWDTTTDPDAVIDDYCRAGFGVAATVIRRFFDGFINRWKETSSGMTVLHEGTVGWAHASIAEGTMLEAKLRGRTDNNRYSGFVALYPASFLSERQAELTEAARLVAGDAASLKRVQFLQDGLQYTRLHGEACRATAAALDAAGVVNPDALGRVGARTGQLSAPSLAGAVALAGDATGLTADKAAVRVPAAIAVGAWETYWQYVRENMGTYTFGEWWVHYRPGVFGEKDGVVQRLRVLAGIHNER